MSPLRVWQERAERNNEVRPRLRTRDLNRALCARPIAAQERRLVEYLVPVLRRGPRRISNRWIIESGNFNRVTVTRVLRKAVEHEFLVRDETTRPHTLALHPKWFEGGETAA